MPGTNCAGTGNSFSPNLMRVEGLNELRRGPGVRKLSVCNRYLRTAEAIASFSAGL